MLPITTAVHEGALAEALVSQGRAQVLAFVRLLLRCADDASLTAEVAEALARDAAEANEFPTPGRRRRR